MNCRNPIVYSTSMSSPLLVIEIWILGFSAHYVAVTVSVGKKMISLHLDSTESYRDHQQCRTNEVHDFEYEF